MQKKEVPCMGYARKDVEKTKKLAKKFVRYQEGAEQFTFYRLPKALIASNEFPTEILLI